MARRSRLYAIDFDQMRTLGRGGSSRRPDGLAHSVSSVVPLFQRKYVFSIVIERSSKYAIKH